MLYEVVAGGLGTAGGTSGWKTMDISVTSFSGMGSSPVERARKVPTWRLLAPPLPLL